MSSDEKIKKILCDLKVTDSILASLIRMIQTDGLLAIEKLSEFITTNLQIKLIESLASENLFASNFNKQISLSQQFNANEKEKCQLELENLYADYVEMPMCAEKILLALFYQTSLKLSNDLALNLNEKQLTKQDLIHQIENQLKERIQIEGLEFIKFDHIINKIKSENWQFVNEELRSILKRIRPFKINEMKRLINAAEKCADTIADSDIILLLGETGAGKSSLIHYLAGSKMIQTRINGLNHIMPTDIKNSALKKVNTSPFANSETRFISAVPIHIEETNEKVVICDTPGFEDTNGPEVDIANRYSIVNAVKNCKSVRIVFLVSYKSMGDRLKGLRKLANTLIEMIAELNSHMKAFSYYFTKFPIEEKNTVHALIGDLRNKMNENEKSNKNFETILNDMFNKTEKNCRMIDLFSAEPAALLYEFMNTQAIHYPDEVFKVSIGGESNAALKDQIRNHELNIMSALKRFDFPLVVYKLDELKYLNEILKQDFIQQSFTQCWNSVKQSLKDNYELAINDFNRSFNIGNNTFSENDIKTYLARVETAESAESHLKDYESNTYAKFYIQNLEKQLEFIVKLKENDLANKLVLERVKAICCYFPKFSKYYDDLCSLTKKNLEKSVSSFTQDYLNTNDFTRCSDELTKVNLARQQLREHLTENEMKDIYEHMKKRLLDYLRKKVQNEKESLSKPNLEEQDIVRINQTITVLQSALESHSLRLHIGAEDLKIILDTFLNELVDCYQIKNNLIINKIEKNDSYSNIEHLMEQLTLIRTIQAVQAKTNRSYSTMFEMLCSSVNESKREITNQLRLKLNSQENETYDTLLKQINRLKTVHWIDKYRNGLYTDLMNYIVKQIIDHAENLKQNIINSNISLKSNLNDVANKMLKLNKLKQLEETVPELNLILTETNHWFVESVNLVLKVISILIEVNSNQMKQKPDFILDHKNFENAVCFLKNCKYSLSGELNESNSVFKRLETLLNKYCEFVDNTLNESFERLTSLSNCITEPTEETILFNDHTDLLKNSFESVKNRLEEINRIELNYPNIFEYFTAKNEKWKKNEYWKRKLFDYSLKLTDEIDEIIKSNRIEQFKTNIMISNCLKDLEGDYGIFKNWNKFTQIHRDYKTIYYKKIEDIYSLMNENINKKDFKTVSASLGQLKSLNEERPYKLEEIKIKLNNLLKNLLDETKLQIDLLKNFIPNEIENLSNNLKTLEAAIEYLHQDYVNLNEIKNEMISIRNAIVKKMNNYIEGIEKLIDSYSFHEAFIKLENISMAFR